MQIKPLSPDRTDDVVELSLLAWAPVFAAIKVEMEPAVYDAFYPEGWEKVQQKSVEDTLTEESMTSSVALVDGKVAGFVTTRLYDEDKMGEIYMIAVHPDYQGQNIGGQLTDFALDELKKAGMEIAMVDTGGDPGHAPARALYEKSGFRVLPIARYFKKI